MAASEHSGARHLPCAEALTCKKQQQVHCKPSVMLCHATLHCCATQTTLPQACPGHGCMHTLCCLSSTSTDSTDAETAGPLLHPPTLVCCILCSSHSCCQCCSLKPRSCYLLLQHYPQTTHLCSLLASSSKTRKWSDAYTSSPVSGSQTQQPC